MKVATIVGNLTRDPEIRETKSGMKVCNFTVAVNNEKRQGREDSATYFRVSAFGKRGEMVAEYMRKGSTVYVTGDIELQQYKNREGETFTDLCMTADRVKFGPKREQQGGDGRQQQSGRGDFRGGGSDNDEFYSEVYG